MYSLDIIIVLFINLFANPKCSVYFTNLFLDLLVLGQFWTTSQTHNDQQKNSVDVFAFFGPGFFSLFLRFVKVYSKQVGRLQNVFCNQLIGWEKRPIRKLSQCPTFYFRFLNVCDRSFQNIYHPDSGRKYAEIRPNFIRRINSSFQFSSFSNPLKYISSLDSEKNSTHCASCQVWSSEKLSVNEWILIAVIFCTVFDAHKYPFLHSNIHHISINLIFTIVGS